MDLINWMNLIKYMYRVVSNVIATRNNIIYAHSLIYVYYMCIYVNSVYLDSFVMGLYFVLDCFSFMEI